MLEIGSLVDGKYRVLSEIGRGGMSVVYMAINEKANKTWAIKEVRKDGIKDFEVVKQGLIVETEMLKRLSHPNLPSIIDVIESEDTLLIVMDYIEGNPLSKSLEEFGAQPQDYVIDWAKQLCDVLDYLHTQTPPIIYRDMKPANVMLKPDGNVTLIDFGTAREFKEKNLADTTCLGTVGYAAPEQFGGMGQTDARTDIYCLGATLYHLVTGNNPCEPPYEILPIRSVNPQLSSGLERILLKCTRKNPNERYQSCAELMYALEHYEEIDEVYKKKQKKKITWFVSALAVSAVFLLGALGFNIAGNSKTASLYESYLKAGRDETSYSEIDRRQNLLNAINNTTYRDKSEAYFELLSIYEKDESLSIVTSKEEEAAGLLSEYKELQTINKSVEELSPAKRADFYYRVGILVYSLYSDESGKYDDFNGPKNAKTWFDNSIESAEEAEKAGGAEFETYDGNRAKIYSSIGWVYNKIISEKVVTTSNRNDEIFDDMKKDYVECWNTLNELVKTLDNDTSEKITFKMQLYNNGCLLLESKASNFKRYIDGLKYEDIEALRAKMEKAALALEGLDDTEKADISRNFKDAYESVYNAFHTVKN